MPWLRSRLLVAVFFAVLSVTALTSATALAVPAEWMLNDRTLAEGGLTSAALKTVAVRMENIRLEFATGVISIECRGDLQDVSPEIVKTNKVKANALVFTECEDAEPGCTVPTTIGMVPVESEVTLDGGLAVKGVVRPQTGTVFTTIRVTGSTCSLSGNKPVTGDFEVLVPEGRDEQTSQLLTVNQGTTGLLKSPDGAVSLKGSALLLLANSVAWSFL